MSEEKKPAWAEIIEKRIEELENIFEERMREYENTLRNMIRQELHRQNNVRLWFLGILLGVLGNLWVSSAVEIMRSSGLVRIFWAMLYMISSVYILLSIPPRIVIPPLQRNLKILLILIMAILLIVGIHQIMLSAIEMGWIHL